MQTLTIRRPDDWHVHLRDGDMLKAVAPYTARQFARAIVMPNLAPPITTVEAAHAYRDRIIAAAGPGFTPLMTCYLTDDDRPGRDRARLRGRRVDRGQALSRRRHHQQRQRRHRHPQHLSGAGADGEDRHGAVRPRRGDRPAGRRVRPRGGVHRARADAASSATFPALKIVFEHITTAEAVEFVQGSGDNIAATVTPQHLIINRNAIFAGGLRPHAYCLPVAKREEHRLAVRKAATSGSPKFFLGTDSAPHSARGQGIVVRLRRHFQRAVRARKLCRRCSRKRARSTGSRRFASENGPRFYGLPLNEGTVTLERARSRRAPRNRRPGAVPRRRNAALALACLKPRLRRILCAVSGEMSDAHFA